MWIFRQLFNFCKNLLRKQRLDEDLDLEIRSYMELSAEEKTILGVSPEQARIQAELETGGLEQIKEGVRDVRVGATIDRLLQDIRYGSRLLWKNLAYAALTVTTVALGIGATTAIFSVVDGVMFKSLPFPNAARLVRVRSVFTATRRGDVASYPDFLDWRARNHVFDALAAFRTGDFTLAGRGEPERLHGAVVSARLFSLLGVSPAIGRSFLPQEDHPAAADGANAVVLSHALWQRDFGSDPAVIGRTIRLDGQPFTVVGVMPPKFEYPIDAAPVELWTTIAVDAGGGGMPMTDQRGAHYLDVIGLLKPGVQLREAFAEMAQIAGNLSKEHPENKPRTVQLVPEVQELAGPLRTPLLVLMGAVVCVLLIVCVNVANLLTAQGSRRYKEIAVRFAMGANRARVVCQLLTENLILSLLGGGLGLTLAIAMVKILVRIMPAQAPRFNNISVDGRLIGFALFISLFSGILFGLAPAFRTSNIDLTESLKENWARSGSDGKAHARFRGLLVGIQAALAVVLLLGATLLLQSFVHLTRVDPGFDPHDVLTFQLNTPTPNAGDPAAFFREFAARVKSVPGVVSVSAAASLPLTGDSMKSSVEIEGHPTPPGSRSTADFNSVETGYFRALDSAIIRGRDFTAHDSAKATPVVIVNRTFAQQFFPNENPIGKHIRPGIGNGYGPGEPPMREIVGIIQDVKQSGLQAEAAPEMYAPLAQSPFSPVFFVVRTATDPRGYAGIIRRQLGSLEKTEPMYHIETLDEYFQEALSIPRLVTLLLSAFAVVAVLLACMGVYGVVSYVTAQRTHEIGIRMALGSRKLEIMRLILTEGLRPAIAGTLAGIAISLKATALLSSLLYGLTPTDPLTFCAIPLLMTGIALMASYLPARRAANLDPMQSLRYE